MSQDEPAREPTEAFPQSDKLLQYISAFSICFIAIYISPQSSVVPLILCSLHQEQNMIESLY